MPQHKSAEKRVRTNEKRRQRNRGVKADIRNATKGFVATLPTGGSHSVALDPAVAETKLREAQSTLAKAAKKGVIKKNTADRRAGRLASALHRAKSGATLAGPAKTGPAKSGAAKAAASKAVAAKATAAKTGAKSAAKGAKKK